MFSSTVLCALAFNAVTLATPDFSNWAPPGDGDLRGPCPAMNSMANHHFFPHDGRNLTVPMIVEVLGEVFNLSPELAAIVGQLGVNTNSPNATSFDLTHLNKHNAFEHDASLSRVDYYWSGEENIGTFDQATFDRFFDHFKGQKYISLEAAAAARYAMVQYSRENNPTFTYESQHRVTSYAETIKYFKTMTDSTGQTRADFVKILFEEERLPFNEGWRPPTDQLNGFVMTQNVMEEVLATPEKSVWFGDGMPPSNATTFDIPECPSQKSMRIRRS